MEWNLDEALRFYQKQGAPADQNALVALLKEMQAENGGALPPALVSEAARRLQTKETFLLAIIRRLPSLRLADTHCLELCGGPSCSGSASLRSFVRRTYGAAPKEFELKITGCMHQCAKGPNIRWDGVLYHGADEELIRSLADNSRRPR